jgi:hypothetical protein
VSTRIRSTWLASAGAVVLVLLFAGLAAGRVVLTDEAPAIPEVTTPDTTASFEDLNGNGVDDDCEEAGTVATDPVAAEAALTAADLDGDGVLSVSEAAQSGWTGGTNCNHGGYVSWVAQGSPEATTEEAAAPTTDCVPVAPPERDPALDEQKNGHGKWVSSVAQSLATGGKNCNQGGAVSEAAKKDHAADAAARALAKAEREAARALAKAEREAARAEAKATKQHGKGKSKNH